MKMGRKGKTAPAEDSPPKKYMGEMSEQEDDEKYGEPLKFEADFSGPIKKRSCTDILCLILFATFLGGWGFVAFFGITYGDISKVIQCLLMCTLSPGWPGPGPEASICHTGANKRTG